MIKFYFNANAISKNYTKFQRPGLGWGTYYDLYLYNDGNLKYDITSPTPYFKLKEGFEKMIPKYNNNKKLKTIEKQNNKNITALDSLLKFLDNNIPRTGLTVNTGTEIYIRFIDQNTEISIFNSETNKYSYKKLNVNISIETYKMYTYEQILNKTNSFRQKTNEYVNYSLYNKKGKKLSTNTGYVNLGDEENKEYE